MVVSEEVKQDVTNFSDKNTEKPLTSAEEYVKIEFPIEKEESSVRYCTVGPNRFRINFYKKKDPKAIFSDSFINRTYYVICSKTDDGWEHRVLKD